MGRRGGGRLFDGGGGGAYFKFRPIEVALIRGGGGGLIRGFTICSSLMDYLTRMQILLLLPAKHNNKPIIIIIRS